MWPSRRPRRAAGWIAVALATACAGNTAPAGYLPGPVEAQASAYGGWMELTVRARPRRVEGELLAVTADSVWVLTGNGTVVLATAGVVRGRLTGYRDNSGAVTGWTALGTVSTISNGLLLAFTAPAWIITGTVAGSNESHVPQRRAPPLAWAELAVFARFPQGMPAGVPPESLKPKDK